MDIQPLQAPNQPSSATRTREAGLALGCATSSRTTWLRCGALCPGSLTSPPMFLSPPHQHPQLPIPACSPEFPPHSDGLQVASGTFQPLRPGLELAAECMLREPAGGISSSSPLPVPWLLPRLGLGGEGKAPGAEVEMFPTECFARSNGGLQQGLKVAGRGTPGCPLGSLSVGFTHVPQVAPVCALGEG